MRRWLAAAVGIGCIFLLAVAYYFLWPHRRRSMESESSPVRAGSASSSEGKPSPLSPATGPQAPLPNEHLVPTPAPVVEQTPQTLAAMIRSLATQPSTVVRVVNVKHDGGAGCHGTLVFTLDDFRFECAGDSRETFRIGRTEVGQVHKNGVQVWKSGRAKKLGRRYHFSMVGRSKDLVQDVFEEWMTLRPV